MTIALHNLKPARGSKQKRFRIGRGTGSGIGTTAGRGTKGQRARTGGRGGLKLMGLKRTIMKLPKFKGMKSPRPDYTVVSLADLARVFDGQRIITPKAIKAKGLAPKSSRLIKILGGVKLTKALVVKSVALSASAKQALEAAGGEIKK